MRVFIATGAFFLAFGARAALAASFCVAGTSMPPQCMYDDVNTCVRAASPPNTYCHVNPEAHLKYFGGLPFCNVRSDLLAQCLFANRGQCESGKAKDSICIQREEVPDGINPYRYDNRAQQ